MRPACNVSNRLEYSAYPSNNCTGGSAPGHTGPEASAASVLFSKSVESRPLTCSFNPVMPKPQTDASIVLVSGDPRRSSPGLKKVQNSAFAPHLTANPFQIDPPVASSDVESCGTLSSETPLNAAD